MPHNLDKNGKEQQDCFDNIDKGQWVGDGRASSLYPSGDKQKQPKPAAED